MATIWRAGAAKAINSGNGFAGRGGNGQADQASLAGPHADVADAQASEMDAQGSVIGTQGSVIGAQGSVIGAQGSVDRRQCQRDRRPCQRYQRRRGRWAEGDHGDRGGGPRCSAMRSVSSPARTRPKPAL